MSHRSKSRVIAFLTAVVFPISAMVAFPSVAEARSLGSWAGHPLDGTARSCFSENAGGTKHNGSCGGGLLRWEVPIPLDGNGMVSIAVRTKSESDTMTISCQAFGVNNSNQLITSSGSPVNNTGTWMTLTLVLPSVPVGGHAIVACNMGLGTQIGSINY